MLPAMTSVDDDNEEIASPLAKKLVYISDNNLEGKPYNDLLSDNKHLPSNDEEDGNKEGSITETKYVLLVDRKLVNAIKKLDAS